MHVEVCILTAIGSSRLKCGLAHIMIRSQTGVNAVHAAFLGFLCFVLVS